MEEKQNRFNQLMFGSRPPVEEKEETNTKPLESSLANLDWNELMNQLQEITVSFQNLKPVLKELSPLLDFFQKKEK